MIFLEMAAFRGGKFCPMIPSQLETMKNIPALKDKSDEELAKLKFCPFGIALKITSVVGIVEGSLDYRTGKPEQWDDNVSYTVPSEVEDPALPTTTLLLEGGQQVEVIGTYAQVMNAVNQTLQQLGMMMKQAQGPQLVLPPPGDLKQMPRGRR